MTSSVPRRGPRTGIVLDPRYLEHVTGRGHPERPERIETLLAMRDALEPTGLAPIEPRPATREELELVHSPEHVDRVEATARMERHKLDVDTPVGPESHATALLAAGGLLEAIDATMRGEVHTAFAKVRPPGHHAEPTRPMGFCLYNNVAIGARHLIDRHGLGRVMILDWDVHHGNGTEAAFYSDPRVLYVSIHQYPHYPGTGAAGDAGSGAGEGRNVNVPLPAGCGDDQYALSFERLIEPIARQFAPEFVLISAGMDCHWRDPLGGMRVTETGVATMTRRLMRLAREHAGGRCVAVLEGGYDLEGLRSSTEATLRELGGGADGGEGEPTAPAIPGAKGEIPRALEDAIAVQRRYWEL